MDESTSRLLANLDAIEAIARDLPRVGKRSELKIKADAILQQIEQIRAHMIAAQHPDTSKYTPNFATYGSGAAGKKE